GRACFREPSCTEALFGDRAAITPCRLQGRVRSVICLASMSTPSRLRCDDSWRRLASLCALRRLARGSCRV
ncbi:hypothetical protein B4Q13_24650, partial [Lacticaseibacillus rhamnosus]